MHVRGTPVGILGECVSREKAWRFGNVLAQNRRTYKECIFLRLLVAGLYELVAPDAAREI